MVPSDRNMLVIERTSAVTILPNKGNPPHSHPTHPNSQAGYTVDHVVSTFGPVATV